jgi:hypothetical protein
MPLNVTYFLQQLLDSKGSVLLRSHTLIEQMLFAVVCCSYMTIFYLQQLQMLPALQLLVPSALLKQPGTRLLQVRLR